jgi:hypothetical protein
MNKFSNCLIAVAMLGLVGCDGTFTRNESSQVMHEEAVVEDAIFSPGIHGSANGVGLDMNLNLQMTSSTIRVPPKYNVVFLCQHGRFVVSNEEIWKKVKKGGKVDLSYVEKRTVTVEVKDGISTVKKIEVYDYDLIDVKPLE